MAPFVVLGAAYVLLRGAAFADLAYIGVFTIARVMHTVAYLGQHARVRRDAYTAGFLVLAAMAIHVAVRAVTRLIR